MVRDNVFGRFRRYAFRLERLRQYRVRPEPADLARQVAAELLCHQVVSGLDEPGGELAPCLDRVFEKVHVLRSPLNDYLRFECEWDAEWTARNSDEQVGIIDLAETDDPGLPEEDFWLFDGQAVVAMHYDQDGRFLSCEQLPAARVPDYVEYRRLALARAVPVQEYWATQPRGARWRSGCGGRTPAGQTEAGRPDGQVVSAHRPQE